MIAALGVWLTTYIVVTPPVDIAAFTVRFTRALLLGHANRDGMWALSCFGGKRSRTLFSSHRDNLPNNFAWKARNELSRQNCWAKCDFKTKEPTLLGFKVLVSAFWFQTWLRLRSVLDVCVYSAACCVCVLHSQDEEQGDGVLGSQTTFSL